MGAVTRAPEGEQGTNRGWPAVAQWFPIIGPLAAALGMQELSYIVVPYACVVRQPALLHIVPVLMLILTAAAGLVARRTWERTGRQWPADEGGSLGRSRFMATLGLITAGAGVLVIVAQWIAIWMLHPCLIM